METFSVTPYKKCMSFISVETRIVCELEVLFALILKALYGRLYEVGFRSIESLGHLRHLRPLIQST